MIELKSNHFSLWMFQAESSPLIEVQPSRICVIHHLNMGKTMVMKAMNPPKQHAKRRES